jgi:hypothetical protein
MYKDYNFRPELIKLLDALNNTVEAGLSDYFETDIKYFIDEILDYKEDHKDMYIDHEIKDRGDN